ncbi:MAG: hypothetical protein JKX69_13465 [Rhodobacteraceae bacterium]|nr:hypothetical protein [Paracoccaceae bacterium]
MSFLLRWIFAALLLCATYNPTQWNYISWSMAHFSDKLPYVALFGLVLFIGYIIYLRATLRSIGVFGMLLVMALVAALIWVLYDLGWLSLENGAANTWLGLFALSIVLATGLSWSIIRRRLSGQADVDDLDD